MPIEVGPGQQARVRVRRFVDADGRTAKVDETYGVRWYASDEARVDLQPQGDPAMECVATFRDAGGPFYVEVEADADLSETEMLFRGRTDDITVVAGQAVGAELMLEVEVRPVGGGGSDAGGDAEPAA
jgi:hypothetical protein